MMAAGPFLLIHPHIFECPSAGCDSWTYSINLRLHRVHRRRPMTAVVQWKRCGCTRVAGNNCPKGRVYVNYGSLRPNVFNVGPSHFSPFTFGLSHLPAFTLWTPLSLLRFPPKTWLVKKLRRVYEPYCCGGRGAIKLRSREAQDCCCRLESQCRRKSTNPLKDTFGVHFRAYEPLNIAELSIFRCTDKRLRPADRMAD